MFIEIIEHKSEVWADGWLKVRRNKNNGKIFPDEAMEVLAFTNYHSNISLILTAIDRLSDEEKLEYKEFVLSAIDGREQSPVNLKKLHDLAVAGGYKDEFDKVISDNEARALYPSKRFVIIKPGNEYIGRLYGTFDAEDCDKLIGDLSKYDAVMFCFPENNDKMYFRKRQFIIAGKDVKLPKKLIFQNIEDVRFISVDMENVRGIVCDNDLGISNVTNLSSDIVINAGKNLYLNDRDFSDFHNIKINKGSSVWFYNVKGFPEGMDLSGCEKVTLEYCDLSKLPEQNFDDVAELKITNSVLPSWLKAFKCKKLTLNTCDMKELDEIEFNQVEEATIEKCYNLPEVMDFRKIGKLSCEDNDYSKVKKMILKDKDQGFDADVGKYKGKIIYPNKSKWYNRFWGDGEATLE